MSRKMSLQDACDLVPDDLPDGAFWAMAHEIAGAEYGEVWGELENSSDTHINIKLPEIRCKTCGKKFKSQRAKQDHIITTGHTKVNRKRSNHEN